MRCGTEHTGGGLEEPLGLCAWKRDAVPASLQWQGLGTERWER